MDYVNKENILWHYYVFYSARFNYFQSHQFELGTSELKPKEQRKEKIIPPQCPGMVMLSALPSHYSGRLKQEPNYTASGGQL